jgi:chondroitin 4-sulfotransferase 11
VSISHKHRFIYVHIPKTGGVSVINALGLEVLGHQPLSHTLNHNSDCDGYLKFCFTRNPWDRAASAFHYLQKGGSHNADDSQAFKKYFSKRQSFQEFIKSDTFKVAIDNQQHFRPMTHYIDMNVDFIGRFESLQEDFNIVCDTIGIPQAQLPHTNKSSNKHYTEAYDDEAREIVAEAYKDDIENFNYEFQ